MSIDAEPARRPGIPFKAEGFAAAQRTRQE